MEEAAEEEEGKETEETQVHEFGMNTRNTDASAIWRYQSAFFERSRAASVASKFRHLAVAMLTVPALDRKF